MSFWRKLFGSEDKTTGSLPSSVGPNLQTASIHEAAERGDLEGVKVLLRRNPHLVHSKNESGQTPLHRAAAYDQKEVASLLIANMADINAKDNSGFTPLQNAAGDARKNVLQFLLANRADVNLERKSGETALHLAAYEGHIEIVEILLANGANVNADSRGHYKTPLLYAKKAGRSEVVELLRKHGGHE